MLRFLDLNIAIGIVNNCTCKSYNYRIRFCKKLGYDLCNASKFAKQENADITVTASYGICRHLYQLSANSIINYGELKNSFHFHNLVLS